MNCDPIARWYRWLEYLGFGGELQRRRIAFLPEVRDARRALVLGDGDGRFLATLVEQNRSASIDYVDLSARMLDLARARAGTDRVHYRQADALTVPLPDSEYDLICTHFFLDCLDEAHAGRLIERAAQAARPRAAWLVSEFREANAFARLSIAALYLFFRIAAGLRTNKLVNHRPLLARAGFHLNRVQTARFGMLVSELWIR